MVQTPSTKPRTDTSRTASPEQSPASGDLHVRNYDHRNGYDLRLQVTDDGTVCFEKRYTLEPGQTVSATNLLADGTYTVAAAVDGGPEATAQVRVGNRPAHTVCVELGNGLVAVSEGVR